MAVFGIDLGNLNSTVSIARRKGIDVIINEVSKRETATYISFGTDKEGRMIGEKGADMKVRNFKNTVTNLKRLVGVRHASAEWAAEEKFCLFRTSEGADGFVLVNVEYEEAQQAYRPEQLIAMMLNQLCTYADREANADAAESGQTSGIHLVDFVLSCPPYYSAFQRKLLTQAAEIAGLNCLTLVTEGTSVALAWGIFQELPEEEENGHVVQFCDFGHSATYITTVRFWMGNMKVLSHVYDKNLGCRDFDMCLVDHFRKEIQTKYKMDVFEQKKAKLRLMAGCEKLRITLSANPCVSLNVECIMDDIDISFPNYQRDHFELISKPLYDRMEALVARAGEGVDIANLHSVELVGGGSYIPKVRGILADAYKKSIVSTMNVSEAVAKGCGLIGAILSPRVRVDFQVHDALVNDIMIGYHAASSTAPSPVPFITSINKQSTLYAHNCSFPKVYDLTFSRKGAFDLFTYYKEPCEEVMDANGSLLLGHWTFSDLPPYKDIKGEVDPEKPVKVAVRFRLNTSGFVTIDAASVSEEYEEAVTVPKPDAEKDSDTPSEVVLKKRTRRIDVTITTQFSHGLTVTQVADLKALEATMHNKDRTLLETQNAKNAVEAYSYEFRSKAEDGGELFGYMSAKARNTFKKDCDLAVEWVYGDGEDVDKAEYVQKLADLRKEGDAASLRKRLREELPFLFKDAEASLLKISSDANRHLMNPASAHIDKSKLKEVLQKSSTTRDFLKKEKKHADTTPREKDYRITAEQITTRVSDVENFASTVFSTPKPAPPTEEKKEEKEKEEEGDEEKEAKEPLLAEEQDS